MAKEIETTIADDVMSAKDVVNDILSKEANAVKASCMIKSKAI